MTQMLSLTATIDDRRPAPTALSLRGLAAALVALFALDNMLLLGFLGVRPLLVAALAVVSSSFLAVLTYRLVPEGRRIGVPTIMICLLVVAILLMLGGEGRLFYAPFDWRVRDAVLADMGNHRWPFDYWLDGRPQILRAPVGMYMVPALLGGGSQLGRDWALFAHNGLVLGLLLAMGSTLFEGRRAQIIALITFVAFSGLDVLGNLIVQLANGETRWDHIEDWANGYQYSAHITQLFWVPQHALAGWTVALTYLLWRRNLAPVSLFAASLPLVAIWSPLILFGAAPFAIYAGLRVLRTGAWTVRDVLFSAVAAMVAIPAFLYLSTDATAVGGGLRPPNAIVYVLIMLLEVMPFLQPVLRDCGADTDRTTVLIAGLCLVFMPCWAIGMFNDFQTRASITPLAILAVAFASWAGRIDRLRTKIYFLGVVVLGSVTGAIGIANAIRYAPSPVPRCSLLGAWAQQSTLFAPHSTYFADRAAFRFPISPADRVSAANPARCWDHPWRMPRQANMDQQGRP